MFVPDDSNIDDASITFEGSGTLDYSLGVSVYPPAKTARWMSRQKYFQHPQAEGKRLSLWMTFSTAKEDKISFAFSDNAAEPNAPRFGQFDLSLTSALGTKDWVFYRDLKVDGKVEVRTPSEGRMVEGELANMHNFLASRLYKALEDKNLKDVDNDRPYTEAEQHLIGLFVDYRSLVLNPHARIGMSRVGLFR